MRRSSPVTAPGPIEALMAGNSLKSDVIPALEAGAWGVHVPHGLTWALEAADPPLGDPARFMPCIADLGAARPGRQPFALPAQLAGRDAAGAQHMRRPVPRCSTVACNYMNCSAKVIGFFAGFRTLSSVLASISRQK
jgi:hypothetical protein